MCRFLSTACTRPHSRAYHLFPSQHSLAEATSSLLWRWMSRSLENFLPAYTHGDNTMVVATDTMKNFILQHALTFSGSTLEGFLDVLGHQFLATYPQMERLRLTGREIAFTPSRVPLGDSAGFGDSKVLFKRSNDDFRMASIDFASNGKNTIITGHRCG